MPRLSPARSSLTCKLTIEGLGTHSGTGEEWADEDNAMTSAEAQAFKRACSCFGLGRYFYDFDAPWVDIDDKIATKEGSNRTRVDGSGKLAQRPAGLERTGGRDFAAGSAEHWRLERHCRFKSPERERQQRTFHSNQ